MTDNPMRPGGTETVLRHSRCGARPQCPELECPAFRDHWAMGCPSIRTAPALRLLIGWSGRALAPPQ